jgi:deoxycytidine triphosphate deaminase
MRPKIATILPDREIRKLFGTVILDGEDNRITPNGMEVRLGKHVIFQSTDEEKELGPGMFLKVTPGESVTIASYEEFDFRRPTVEKVYPGCDLMVLLTPTTTMMREGIFQSATKGESGWHGHLNWGFRNSSIKDLILAFGEPIFKITLFLLKEGETPDIRYGERENDRYQNTQGIARSTRMIPTSIAKNKIVSSSIERLDPAKQLREAGHPFNYIGTELTTLDDKITVVSNSVSVLKQTIETETGKLSKRVDESQRTVLEKVEDLFNRKFYQAVGVIIGCLSLMFGTITFLRNQGINGNSLGVIAVIGGLGVFLVLFLLSRRPRHSSTH